MSYVVLARKWRPQTFDQVIGQEHVTTTLKNSIKAGRIAHAYLFSGPRGVGKTSTARILSKALNCEKGPTSSPCLKCVSCKEITAGNSLDILEIDGASNRGIDEIRNLRANIGFAPATGKYKVYIIDEVHMLTTEAFNALLKTLEEPPAHVKFIFATTQPHKVPATILSRCQRFDFRRITVIELVEKLQTIVADEKIKAGSEALLYIARAADGSMRDAETILDQLISFCEGKIEAGDVTNMLGMVSQDIFIELTRAVVGRDSAAGLKIVDNIINQGKDISQFLAGVIEHFRNIMVAKVSPASVDLIDLPADQIKILNELAQQLSFEEIFFIFNILSQTEYNIKRSNLIRSPLEMAVIKITRLNSLVSVPEMIDQLAALEQKIKTGPVKNIASRPSVPVDENPGRLEEDPGPFEEPGFSPEKKVNLKKNAPPRRAEAEIQADTLPPEPGSDLKDISKNWSRILAELSKESPACSAYLSAGRPIKFEQGTLIIKFGQTNSLHKRTLEDLKNRQMLKDVFKKVLGTDIQTSLVLSGSAQDQGQTDDSEQTGSAGPEPDYESPDPEMPAEETQEIEPIVKTAAKIFKAKKIKVAK